MPGNSLNPVELPTLGNAHLSMLIMPCINPHLETYQSSPTKRTMEKQLRTLVSQQPSSHLLPLSRGPTSNTTQSHSHSKPASLDALRPTHSPNTRRPFQWQRTYLRHPNLGMQSRNPASENPTRTRSGSRLLDVNFLNRNPCAAGGNGYSSGGFNSANFLLMKFNRCPSVGGRSTGAALATEK
jgi:hypothetical protein